MAGASKSLLTLRRQQLALYRQVLPSLELKRQQLIAERLRERQQLQHSQAALDQALQQAGAQLPMLATTTISLDGLLSVERVVSREVSLLGTPLPHIFEVHFAAPPYGLLTRPHWVDAALERLRDICRLRLEIRYAEERVLRLDRAVRKALQRVNLFREVLIPAAQADLAWLHAAQSDSERAAVVRSKIFKARHQQAAAGRQP